ncbi:MAG: ABC transporter ATP-binding protein [Candidatus Omnitrophica bacterium]|nr:ABC transporter ATP-binding protein [Candidatus Omnitrophota bacterium]
MNSRQINDSTWTNVKKLFAFLKLRKMSLWLLAWSVFFSFCFTLLALYTIYLLFPIIKGIIKNDFSHVQNLAGLSFFIRHFPKIFASSTSFFILLVVWIYLVSVLKNIFYYLSFFTTWVQAKFATESLRQLLIEKCFSFEKKFYDTNTVSYLQSVLTRSTSVFKSQFVALQEFLTHFLLLTVYLIIMFLISWKLACLAAVFFPLVAFFTEKITRNIRSASLEHDRTKMNFNEKIFNILYCMPVIKSFVKEHDEIRNFAIASAEEQDASYNVKKLESLIAPIENMSAMTGIMIVALGLSAIIRTDQSLGPAQALVFFYLAMQAAPRFNAFNQLNQSLAKTASALHDIEYILNQDPSSTVTGGTKEFTGLKEHIRFNGLSFQYENSAPLALDNICFSIAKGSVVAIVGPSGSGKSTLINLLLRFYDCPPNTIFVDNTDIRDYAIPTLRRHMAFAGQDVRLFNDTVRNNILYGSSAPIADSVLSDLETGIGITALVNKMPDKHTTMIGDKGSRLSRGERQKVAVARALINNPGILIMDEATNSLDATSETGINALIMNKAAQVTLIMVAHKFSTIKKADLVIYLENGRVIESGTLQELIDKKGSFYTQWETQKI